tara:strand:+ start:115 stop:702 length:588 start_codon:yes stop_codon:yes gene_type:complete
VNFSEAKEYIVNRLVKELPKNLFYHAAHHTFDVVKHAQTIGKSEGISNDEMFILLTAAYFHDAGFLFRYQSNEPEAVKLAREVLPEMDYTQEEIDEICKIILATDIKVQPNTLLEKIMCDADHDYFGREGYSQIADNLRKELEEYGTSFEDKEWLEVQINFLEEKHQYYTDTSSEQKQKMKEGNIKVLKTQLSTF